MTLLYDVPRRWSLYLKRCEAVLALEAQEAPEANFSFTLDTILLKLGGGCYIGPIIPGTLLDILAGWIPAGNSGGGSGKRSSEKGSGGGVVANAAKVETSRGAMRV